MQQAAKIALVFDLEAGKFSALSPADFDRRRSMVFAKKLLFKKCTNFMHAMKYYF